MTVQPFVEGLEKAMEFEGRMGAFLAEVLRPVPGEIRLGEPVWVPLLDDDGRPVLDVFGEPEMVCAAPPLPCMTIRAIPRFTGVLAYLAEAQR